MRVLWFSITPGLLGKDPNNAGGWIESLERIVMKRTDVDLGVVFEAKSSGYGFSVLQDGVKYYPINITRNKKQKRIDKYTYKEIDPLILNECKKIILDFNPDIIHIFGSEWCYGLLYKYTKIPIIIHMQGSWPPYRNAIYPPGFSREDFILKNILQPRKLFHFFRSEHLSKERALREEEILSNTKYFFGRTRWDKALVSLYSPNAKYFYCSEALRLSFIEHNIRWSLKNRGIMSLVTTCGGHSLKGLDTILKTAKLLVERFSGPFCWRLLGPTVANMEIYEKKIGITCASVNVLPMGNQNESVVKETLVDSDIYVHTAYIDNSPNAVCEAQYIGMPVISTNVGGVSSLFSKRYDEDFLVPANDPYFMASSIISLFADKKKMLELATDNYNFARERHDCGNIEKDLFYAYNSILKE